MALVKNPVRLVSVAAGIGTSTAPAIQGIAFGHRGFVLQSLSQAGSVPTTAYIGLNKQQPNLYSLRDVYRYTDAFDTIELYNYTNVILSALITLFDGEYIPSVTGNSLTIAGAGSGVFLPVASSQSTLAAIPTTGLTVGTIIEYVDSVTFALQAWQLVTDATSPVTGPGVTVPVDYNSATNPKVWHEV